MTRAFVARSAALAALVALLGTSGCGRSGRDIAKEDAGAPNAAAARIVSVGSAVTETVFALGAGDKVVGVDTSSLFPDAATKLAQVGYQRTLFAEGLLALRPTLILATAEAGPPAALEQLRGAGVTIEMVPLDPTVDGARARIRRIATLVDKDPAKVLATLDAELAEAARLVATLTVRPKVLVLYARGAGTMQVFGRHTAADTIVGLSGGTNAVTGFDGTKPLTPESLVEAAPDVILIPARGLESLGGVDGLLRVPGVAATPAGKARRVLPMDDLLLLGFGPRTGQAALELARRLHAVQPG